MRSVLDLAELELKGVPGVVFVEPSWYEQAKFIARGANLPEHRIQVLPLGKVTANSIDALELVNANLPSIIDGVVKGLQ